MINVLAGAAISGLAPLGLDHSPATQLQRDAVKMDSPVAAAMFEKMAQAKWQVPPDDVIVKHLGFAS